MSPSPFIGSRSMLSMVLPLSVWLLPYTLNSHVNGSPISAFGVFTLMMPLLVSMPDTANAAEAVLLRMVWAFNAPFPSMSTLMPAVAVTVPDARLDTVPLKCRSGRLAVPSRFTSGTVFPSRGVNTSLSPSTLIRQNGSSQVGSYRPAGLVTVMVGSMPVPDSIMLFICPPTV